MCRLGPDSTSAAIRGVEPMPEEFYMRQGRARGVARQGGRGLAGKAAHGATRLLTEPTKPTVGRMTDRTLRSSVKGALET